MQFAPGDARGNCILPISPGSEAEKPDGIRLAQIKLEKEGIMSGTTKATTVRSHVWKAKCREWAQAGESFEINGIGAQHLAFCKDLCEEFNYSCDYQSHGQNSTAVFNPAAA